jgi:hypothetical protein
VSAALLRERQALSALEADDSDSGSDDDDDVEDDDVDAAAADAFTFASMLTTALPTSVPPTPASSPRQQRWERLTRHRDFRRLAFGAVALFNPMRKRKVAAARSGGGDGCARVAGVLGVPVRASAAAAPSGSVSAAASPRGDDSAVRATRGSGSVPMSDSGVGGVGVGVGVGVEGGGGGGIGGGCCSAGGSGGSAASAGDVGDGVLRCSSDAAAAAPPPPPPPPTRRFDFVAAEATMLMGLWNLSSS